MLLNDFTVIEVTTIIDVDYDDAKYVVKEVTLFSGENHIYIAKPIYTQS